MNVYIPGTGFATQGPCAEGFHIPNNEDFTKLIQTLTGLGLSGSAYYNSYVNYLFMPFAGYFVLTSKGGAGSEGRYWFSDTTSNIPRSFIITSSSAGKSASYAKCNGFSIRPFKDIAVIPDSNWTVLYQGTGDAGICHNASEGIISISSDGTNWITIADKNLGATTVYNSGATLSEANCGKYYQRGNNYGFNWDGSITTTSTKIDASGYGPGNYYSSSNFYSGSGDWSSVTNNNLRGGVDGNVQVVNELKNAYIGEVIECNFTQSDCGFTLYYKDSTATASRDSNGLYVTGPTAQRQALWNIPSSIYSNGNLEKFEITFIGTGSQPGCGFGYSGDSKKIRHYNALRIVWGTQNNSSSAETLSANTEYIFTADFKNKVIYSTKSSATLALTDNAISAFNTDWSAGNVKLQEIIYQANTYTYIKKAVFYF